jgi:hypothetical protein
MTPHRTQPQKPLAEAAPEDHVGIKTLQLLHYALCNRL